MIGYGIWIQLTFQKISGNLVAGSDEPAFAWWVPDVLRKREQIISAVKARYLKRTHKFGICMPKSVKEALKIDHYTNTSTWLDAIRKEMKNVMPAFKVLEPNASKPVGYTWIP
jgi:hypothetical protein